MLKSLRSVLVAVVLLMSLVLGSCTSQSASQASPSPTPLPLAQSPDLPLGSLPRLEGKATVELVVKGGTIAIEVDGTNAPITAGNFVDLVQRGVYNGLAFHRIVRSPKPFVVQGGDPQGKNPAFPAEQLGTGSFIDTTTGQPRYIPLEIKPAGSQKPLYHRTFEDAGITDSPVLKHQRGAVAMARSPQPDSASAQFYIALADINFLDGSYAVFGYVTQGMEIVDKIQMGDRIESARVTQGADNLKLKS